MTEAAAALGVTNHVIRRLVKTGVLPADQVVRGAPYQIRSADLTAATVKSSAARKGRPCRDSDASTLPMLTDT
nr:helix-turn-helix domain-containing protein [Sphingomonas populi]